MIFRYLQSFIFQSKSWLCRVSSCQFCCSKVGGWLPSHQVEVMTSRPGEVVVSLIVQIDCITSDNVVAAG